MKFKYGDRVIVKKGFYKGLKGTVYNYFWAFFEFEREYYLKDLDFKVSHKIDIWIKSKYLELESPKKKK